jgi:TRAP transporter 4TM/12TM fusion protein
VPYISIAASAALPAFLFYAALMVTVYLRALKTNLPVIDPKDITDLKETILNYGHLIPPIFLLLGLMIAGWSLLWSAFWSIVAMVALAMLRKNTRMSIFQMIEALRDAAEKAVPIFVACASAGIIYGIISLTGLGFQVSSLLLSLAGGNNILILLLTMVSALLLGFAMPPTAAYIILAALVIPSLKEAGLPILVSHMFIFFFCSIGPITPPVALAAYSAAAIANSDPNKTGFTAVRLGLPAFIIPFLFVYSPSLLLIGSLTQILFATLKALLALIILASSLEGYLFRRLHWYERIVLFIVLVLIMWTL